MADGPQKEAPMIYLNTGEMTYSDVDQLVTDKLSESFNLDFKTLLSKIRSRIDVL